LEVHEKNTSAVYLFPQNSMGRFTGGDGQVFDGCTSLTRDRSTGRNKFLTTCLPTISGSAAILMPASVHHDGFNSLE